MPGRDRTVAVLAVVLAGTVLLTAAGMGVVQWGRPGSATAVRTPAAGAAPTPTSPAPTGAAVTGTQARAAVLDPAGALATLLTRRARAVREQDRAGWLATVDPADRRWRTAQATAFDRISRLDARSWTYRLVDAATLPPRRRAALGAPSRLLTVTLAYRLGADSRDVQRQQSLTVVQRGDRWYVAADTDGRTERDLWDVTPVTVVRGERSLVVGASSRARMLPQLARDADAAAVRVDRVWRAPWPRTVVVVVPATVAQMATLLGRPVDSGLDQVAAVTSGELQRGGATPAGVADRVVVNPVAFADFSPVGRRVVLTHEFTHVATRASALVATPLWVEEGFADYVGYLDAGLPRSVIAADLMARVREGKLPGRLPTEDDFDPSGTDIAPAYAGSWLAMDLIARDGGTGAVVDFYRVAAGLPPIGRPARRPGTPLPSQAQALRQAFTGVVGVGQARFQARWRAYLRTVASAPSGSAAA